MRTAVIKNNKVENIIVAAISVYPELETALGATLVNVDGVECGISWTTEDGGQSFTAPESESTDDPYAIIDALTGENGTDG